MKLGVVAEHDRLPDSPDTIIVVEPSVGSVARSKGNLYLLVTSLADGNRIDEATRLAAETIRNEYYYDESAGIRVCIEKAIAQANKRLTHQRDRLGLGHAENGSGPIGVGVAVVRGNELYVATVGPAEAYLIRQARLSTLPDPHRERGLPADELEPDVWRGDVNVGDSLVLVSPNIVAQLGVDELKDALVTLHPQSAMEHLHHRFVAADGKGSDGMVAFEATEVTATAKHRTLVPVKPPEPLAGAPERSPIPLADPVVDGVAAVQAGARAATTAAGSAFGRSIQRLQDVLPRRRPAHRRVTPLAAKRERQRRAAVALLAFIVVVVGLGVLVYALGGAPGPGVASSFQQGQTAIRNARDALDQVFAPGVNLVRDNREQALQLLTAAWNELEKAEDLDMPASTVEPLRERVIEGLDELYHVVPIAPANVFAFKQNVPANIVGLVRGPDGAPYILDRGTKTVYRIDVRGRRAVAILRAGQVAAGARAAEPRFITLGGPDLLILDARNTLWRWTSAHDRDDPARGTLRRVNVNGQASWGNDIRAIGTWLRDADDGLYNFYVVDPSEQQILRYAPAADGSGFPRRFTGYLSTKRVVDKISSMYIDGDLFVADDGVILRYASGREDGWEATPPGDELLRPAPRCTRDVGDGGFREGRLYCYDPENARVIAFDKAEGDFIEQYRLTGDHKGLTDARAMYAIPGVEGAPATLIWATETSVLQAVLEAVPDEPEPSTSPGAAPSPARSRAPGSAAP
jgi:serine/threonine protein phosphatase PrpC